MNSIRIDAGLDAEAALVFVDPLASRGGHGTLDDGESESSDDGGESYGDDANVSSDLPLPRATHKRDEGDRGCQDGGAHTPYTKKQQKQEANVTPTECPEEGAVGNGRDHHALGTTTPESLSTPRGSIQRTRSTGGLPAPRDGASGGSNALRSSLRPPLGGGSSNSLSRSGTLSRGLGGFRGTPPSLHRRLSAPTTGGGGSFSPLERRGKGQKQRYGSPAAHRRGSSSGPDVARLRASKSWDARTGEGAIGDEDEMARAVPPPPPSLFESVFKDKLPSLTPKKATPVTPRQGYSPISLRDTG